MKEMTNYGLSKDDSSSCSSPVKAFHAECKKGSDKLMTDSNHKNF
jgi:hypothetical protein